MPLLACLAFRTRTGRRFLGLGLLLLLASALTSAPPAFAQYSDYGSSRSSVTINWGALDALGPAPTAPGAVKRDHAAKAASKAHTGRKVVLHRPAKHAKKATRTAHKARHPAQARTAAKHRVAHAATKSPAKPAAKVTAASTAPAAHPAPPAKPTTAAASEPTAKASAAPAPVPAPPATAAAAPDSAAAAAPVEAAAPAAPSAVAAPAAPNRPHDALAPPAPAGEPHLAAVAAPAAPQHPAAIPVAAPATVASAMNSINFPSGASDVPSSAHAVLDALAARLAANDSLRLQVVAYAKGNDDEASQARRLSLARAIAVRAYLIEKGVSGVRMDVRALGNRTTGTGPADRVDLVVLNR